MYFNPLALIPAFSGLIAVLMCLYAWRRRDLPVAIPFAGLLAAITLYAVGYTFELSSNRLDILLGWVKLEYLGIATIPAWWLMVVLQYTGHGAWLTRRNTALLFIIPALTILLHYTTSYHQLHYAASSLDTSGPFPILAMTPGPWYWVQAIHLHTSILITIILLAKMLRQVSTKYRRQVLIMMLGALPPWISYTLYLTKIGVFARLDPTPFALSLTGGLLAWGIFSFRLLDLVPIAYSHIIESMGDAVLVVGTRNRLVDANPAAQRLLGWQTSPIGQTLEQALANWPELLTISQAENSLKLEATRSMDGKYFTYEITSAPLTDLAGGLAGRALIIHDITQHKFTEETLRQSEKRFRDLVDLLPVGIYETDNEGKIIFANRTALEMFGYTSDDFAALARITLDVLLPEEQRRSQNQRKQAIENGIATGQEYTALRKTGETFSVLIRSRAIEPGNFHAGTRGVIIDNTEQKKVDEALREAYLVAEEANRELHKAMVELDTLATTDKLTGAFNRRRFEEIIEYEVNQANRYQRQLSLVIFDIDFFKRVNDTFGHQVGDLVLAEIAQVVTANIRKSDSLARWGGEEFTILAPGITLPQASQLAEKIRLVLSAHPFPKGASITVSLGVAEFHKGDIPDRLLKRADDALYRAKTNGRNRVELENYENVL